jgi:hypothetical protein
MKATLLLLAGVLAGCQSWQERAPAQVHPPAHRGSATGAGSSGATGSTGSGTGEETGRGDQRATCDTSRRIMGARTPAERQALMDQNMPDMSPELREQHLQMMLRQCM